MPITYEGSCLDYEGSCRQFVIHTYVPMSRGNGGGGGLQHYVYVRGNHVTNIRAGPTVHQTNSVFASKLARIPASRQLPNATNDCEDSVDGTKHDTHFHPMNTHMLGRPGTERNLNPYVHIHR